MDMSCLPGAIAADFFGGRTRYLGAAQSWKLTGNFYLHPASQCQLRFVHLVCCPSYRTTDTSLELFNAQSISNKSSLIHDHILEKNVDLMCLTETWYQLGFFSSLNEACPPGYSYLQWARWSRWWPGCDLLLY